MNQELIRTLKNFKWQRRISFAAFIVIAALMLMELLRGEEPGSAEVIILMLSVLFGSQAAQGEKILALVSKMKDPRQFACGVMGST